MGNDIRIQFRTHEANSHLFYNNNISYTQYTICYLYNITYILLKLYTPCHIPTCKIVTVFIYKRVNNVSNFTSSTASH